MDEHAWQRKSAAILTDIKEWRRTHPKATFVEIEDEVHQRVMELEAQVLQDAAQASASREWGHTSGQAGPLCPTCAIPLEARGKHQRTLQSNGGESVQLIRTYGTCPKCGAGLFPLDEELGLLPGTLAPRQQEHLVHLASCMSFQQAAQMLAALLGVQVSAETARRLTEQVGTWMEAAELIEAVSASPQESRAEPVPQRAVISCDGAMVSLIKKQWVEVRTVAIGQPHEQRRVEGEPEVHIGQLSYFSRLADASIFTELADVEMQRRQVREAEQVCAVTDGADWCQAFTQRHRPDALRILDFPHAAEHVSKLLEALVEAGLHFPDKMLARCLHVLKHRGPRRLLHLADRLGCDLALRKGVQEQLDYLRKREALMRYPVFADQGWPIGSGMVESANKNVVEARLKGTGMHWERKHVNPVLALRTTVCNDRWREMWGRALTSHRKQQALHRSARATSRAQAFLAGGEASSQASPPPSAAISEQVSPPAPSQLVVEAEDSALPPPPVPEASQPSSCRPSRRRTRQRVNCSRRSSSHVNADVCLCGMPLVRFKGHRPKQYCSDRCRQRAHRKRQAPIPAHLALARQFKRQARHGQVHRHLQHSPHPFVRKDPQTCPCGTPLVREKGHRPREYCSDRCRQRARRERQAQGS